MTAQASLFLVAAAALWSFPSSVATDDATASQAGAAKQVLEQFIQAVLNEDLGRFMEVADVPFYWNAGRSVQVFQSRDELKKHFHRFFDAPNARKPPAEVRLEVKEVRTYDKARGELAKKLKENDPGLLDQVLKKGDLVLFVEVKSAQGKRLDRWTALVRFQNAQAKLAGYWD